MSLEFLKFWAYPKVTLEWVERIRNLHTPGSISSTALGQYWSMRELCILAKCHKISWKVRFHHFYNFPKFMFSWSSVLNNTIVCWKIVSRRSWSRYFCSWRGVGLVVDIYLWRRYKYRVLFTHGCPQVHRSCCSIPCPLSQFGHHIRRNHSWCVL